MTPAEIAAKIYKEETRRAAALKAWKRRQVEGALADPNNPPNETWVALRKVFDFPIDDWAQAVCRNPLFFPAMMDPEKNEEVLKAVYKRTVERFLERCESMAGGDFAGADASWKVAKDNFNDSFKQRQWCYARAFLLQFHPRWSGVPERIGDSVGGQAWAKKVPGSTGSRWARRAPSTGCGMTPPTAR
jgi:hypothetical protein